MGGVELGLAPLLAVVLTVVGGFISLIIWIWRLRQDAKDLGEARTVAAWEAERRHEVEQLLQREKDQYRELVQKIIERAKACKKAEDAAERLSRVDSARLSEWVRDNYGAGRGAAGAEADVAEGDP